MRVSPFDLLRELVGEERVECDLQPGFPLERLAERENFLSLLHYFGLASIRGLGSHFVLRSEAELGKG